MTAILYKKPDVLAHENMQTGHVVIEASAGTGKTFTLEHLVVDLLLRDLECSIDNILVVTFTRRATAELRRRVRAILTKVLAHYEGRDKDELCSALEPHWKIDDDAARRLREAMLNFDSAEIFTIHSFCQKLLTENAFQNHQLFDLELVDEKALFAECYEDILRTEISTDPALRGWFDAWMDPRVSGKIDALGEDLKEIYSSKGKLARSAHTSVTFLNAKALLEDVEETTVQTHLDRKSPGWKTDILGHLLAPVVAELERRKQSEGLYAYDDLLTLVAESLRPERANNGLLETLRGQYKYALIDEFQDTDQTQWDIFHRLFVTHDGSHRLFLIGDPKQAIYKFRGADVWTYLRAVNEISPDPEDRVLLETNYRATTAMVNAYNEIFKQIDGSLEGSFFSNAEINYTNAVKPKSSEEKEEKPVTPASVERGAITAMRIALETEKKGTKADFAPRWIDWMLTEIESLLWGQGQFEIAAAGWPLNASDIYILTNTNRESREIGGYLKSRGIPYAFYRQGGLFQSAEALDILAILQAINQPGRRDKRRGAYRTPFFAVPIRELIEFEKSSAGERAKSLLLEWRKIAQEHAFTRLFRKILDDSGILIREVLLGQGERALTNYQHMFEVLGEQASQNEQSLEELISWLARKIDGSDGEDDQDLQRLETDRPAVQVMTMHKSKGLEAEVVFIYGGFADKTGGVTTFINSDDPSDINAERITVVSTSKEYFGDEDAKKATKKRDAIPKQLHPQKIRVIKQSQWDSERVMYVAITRAKSRLYLCYTAPDEKKTTYGRQSRHEALARSLDRLYKNNPLPNDLRFIDIGPVGSHEHAMQTVQVNKEAWDKALKKLNDLETPKFEPDSRAKIRAAARTMTAFSSVKKHDPPRKDDLPDEQDEDIEPMPDTRFTDATRTPWGGTEYGSFLHNILEDLSDYSSTLNCADAAEWLARDEVKRVFDHRGKVDRIGEEFQPYSARILFDTLRTPLALPGIDRPVSIAQIPMSKIAKEIDFHFPMPQENIDFGPWPEDAPTIERGWIKGSIDLSFEHQSKIYIADWKSNYFKDFRAGSVANEIDKKYALQARIYTLAIVRMLGISDEQEYGARFGGCAYLMLRAMRPEAPVGHGVAICRPSWDELRIWDENLRQHPDEWNAQPLAVFS